MLNIDYSLSCLFY